MALSGSLQRVLEKEVMAYRAQSFENFLSVEVSFNACSKRARRTVVNRSFDEYNMYIFGEEHERVQVRLVDSTIHVRRHGVKTNIQAIMRSVRRMPNPLDDADVQGDLRQLRAWKLLQDWWAMNSRVFDFLSLPGELRSLVYSMLYERPSVVYASHLFSGYGLSPVLALLELRRLNHRICSEVSGHISLHSTFRIMNSSLKEALHHPWMSRHMRHIEVHLVRDEALSFFGCVDGDQQCREFPTAARQLKELDLLSLHIMVRVGDTCETPAMPFEQLLLAAMVHGVRGQPCRLGMLARLGKDDLATTNEELRLSRLDYLKWRDAARLCGMTNTSTLVWHDWICSCSNEFEGGVPVQEA